MYVLDQKRGGLWKHDQIEDTTKGLRTETVCTFL